MHVGLLDISQIFVKKQLLLIPNKDKSPTNPINYGLISLLEVPGKIFERIIQARLNTFYLKAT